MGISPGATRKRARIDNSDTPASLAHHAMFAVRESAMKVTVKKWGNSATVRIPAAVITAAALSLDQAVDVREEAGRIVIGPIRWRHSTPTIRAGITDENRHDAVDTGAPRGREFW
jgi:antitoxin MazE